MSSHLQGGRIDISLIQATARKNLIDLIEKCPGTKAIVWDQTLAGPVGLIAQYKILREYSVIKMYPLRSQPLPETDVQHIIFITRPKLLLMDYVANNVHYDLRSTQTNNKKQYHLFFVPRTSLLCLERLKHKGVYGSILLIDEFKCELFPFDSDVVSMEINEVYRELQLENDPTYLYQIAQAILTIQNLYGPILHVWGKGVAAKQVWDLIKRLQREQKTNNQHQQQKQQSNIDHILLIDRSIDLITPLATQLTYEGLIDELFGINNTTAIFPIDNFLNTDERTTKSLNEDKKQIILNSNDKLYNEIRDKNFNAIGNYLSKQAKLISKQLETTQEKSVQEMKLYVQRLPQLFTKKQQLSNHTAIAECIKDITDTYEFLDVLQIEQEFLNCIDIDKINQYIDDMIATNQPLIKILRLLCLQCLTNSGFKLKIYEHYKRELVHNYGLDALISLNKLEKCGLIKIQSSIRQYTVLRKALHLTTIEEDISEIDPTDICYVHSIYAPLTIRLTEHLIKNYSWKHIQDVLGLLPGPTLDETPLLINNNNNNQQQQQQQQQKQQNSNDTPQVVLVFFIGGCTFAEISALRFLSQQDDSNVEFVIATTKLINGTTFIKSIIE